MHFGTIPDLACYGTEIANGWALQAVAGSRNLIDRYSTRSSAGAPQIDSLALVAAQATLEQLSVESPVDGFWEEGRKLRDGINVIAKALHVDEWCACVGPPACASLRIYDYAGLHASELETALRRALARRGVLVESRHWLSAAHEEAEIEACLRSYRAALGEIVHWIESDPPSEKREGDWT